MLRRQIIFAVAFLSLVLFGLTTPNPAAEPAEGWMPLFNGKDFTGWRKFVDPKSQADPDGPRRHDPL